VTTHGQSIKWTDRRGTVTTVTATQCAAANEAICSAIESATAFGWTYPKWWEFWRWNDTRPQLEGTS
jgi:hypothetical protein